MALIDIDELLTDPDFVDTMIQYKRTAMVNLYGENVIKEMKVITVGSIQPADHKTIQRLPEALRVADVKSFWIKGTITATAPGKYTDILEFKGQRYQVQTVEGWENWGQGYAVGTAVAEVPAL